MTHNPVKAHIAAALQKRVEKIPNVDRYGILVVQDFGIFIDTHRDQPHVGSFNEDIHRGQCAPTMVDYVLHDDMLRHQETGKLLIRHDKHLFITPDEWSKFLVEYLMTHGTDPRAGDGTLPTSHFRDPRQKPPIYLLKSFRQMVDWHLQPPSIP